MVKISVIIPVYNSEKYLKQCLDTVCGQTLHDIEIICVDDGSVDSSQDILREYQGRDSRVSIIYRQHKEGVGAGAARNTGLKVAAGKYLCFLDSDDFFEADMLELAYERAEKEAAQLVMWSMYEYDQRQGKDLPVSKWFFNKKLCPTKEVFSSRDVAENIFQITGGMPWNILFRHDYIKQHELYFQETRFRDDILFTFLALTHADRISFIDKELVHYRLNTGVNQSEQKYQYIEIMYVAIMKIYQEMNERGLYETFKVSFLNYAITVMLDYILKQKEYEKYKASYELLKGELTEKMGLRDYLEFKPGQVFSIFDYTVYKMIMDKAPGDFLLELHGELAKYKFAFPETFVHKEDKVVLYGAGVAGKNYFNQNFEKNYCRIVGWVDRAFEEKGFPVCAPEEILNMDYDKILIAIENRKIAEEIKQYLIGLGINTECILLGVDYYFEQ